MQHDRKYARVQLKQRKRQHTHTAVTVRFCEDKQEQGARTCGCSVALVHSVSVIFRPEVKQRWKTKTKGKTGKKQTHGNVAARQEARERPAGIVREAT